MQLTVRTIRQWGYKIALITGVSTLAIHMALADSVSDRNAAMKDVGKAMKSLADTAKGAVEFVGEDVEKNAQTIVSLFEVARPLFDNGEEVSGSRAKATIWSDAAGFSKEFDDGIAAAKAVADAGAEYDEDAFKAAFGELGGSCKSCHESYRLPKE
ncbi:MAG: cytochrome c [Alphaproteobacteria bacterium]|nr:cytochrome c [Alphaproteobacteria bacterium]